MTQVTINLPDETVFGLNLSAKELSQEIQMVLAVKLYELNKLSAGGAALLAGVPKPFFLSRLSFYGIDSFRFTKEDLISDLKNA
jgi:predicted HTH domain antitoxin